MSNEEAMEIVLEAAKHRASILPFQSDKRKKILEAACQLQSRLTWQQKYGGDHVILEDHMKEQKLLKIYQEVERAIDEQ